MCIGTLIPNNAQMIHLLMIRIKNMSIFRNKRGIKFFIASRVFWFMFVLYLQPRTVKLLDNSDVFSDNHNTPAFNHLAVDDSTQSVFIGAVNRLYKLSRDLKLLNNVTTTSNPNSTNYNEILVINKLDQRLIACGCATEFVCEIYNFNDGLLKLSRISQNKISGLNENNTCVSTMAFIAYGNQGTNDDGLPKLYFAASFSSYVSKQQAIAIRTFNPNNISEADENGRAFDSDELIIKHRDVYQVNYVYGFKSGKYKYFLTTQRNSTERESPYVSKLIRICKDGGEPLSKGYAEIPIECKLPDNKGTYNLVQTATAEKPGLKLATSLNITLDDDILFGVFSKVQEIKPTSNEPSNKSVLCIYSMKSIDEKINENIRNCFSGTGSRGFDFLSQNQNCIENNQSIDSNFCISNANMPIVGNMPISAPAAIPLLDFPTAIATKPSENGYDVFIGTKTGHLKMINLRDSSHACENTDLEIDKESPVNSDLLFSPQKESLYVMTKRKLTKIKLELFNCSSYTIYESCVKSNKEFCGWCGSTNACTKTCDCPSQIIIANISSKNVQIGASETIQLRIPSFHLISPNESIRCAFKIAYQYLYTDGRSSMNDDYNVRCPVPEVGEFSRMQEDRDYSNVDLLIYASKIWGSAHTKIYFTYCNGYAFCNACVSSTLECQWHLKEKKCMYYEKNITNDASIISDETSCKNIVEKHEQNILNISSNHTFSNTRNSSSECLNLATSCISCTGSDKKHNCGWCQNTNTCESGDNCSGPLVKYPYSCPGLPSPIISSFRPQSGPWEGGTNITIQGGSLFYKFDDKDINQNITVAGVVCTPYRDTYVPMKSITCAIEKSSSSRNQTGPVVLHLNGTSITSAQYFEFVDLKITGFFPKEGPSYGGTVLAIKGENLNAGRSIEIRVGNSSCSAFSRNSTTVQCITHSSILVEQAKIFVKLDGNIHNPTNNSFSYIEDPQRDENGFNYGPKGIPAGNVAILIRDVNLTSTQQLLLHIHHEKRTYTSSCNISSDSNKTWTCLSPVISDIDSGSIDAKNPVQMNVSLSNAASNKSYIPSKNQSLEFLLYPNPEFHYFLNSSIEFDDYNYIIIKGKNIDKACQKTDINVNVGNETCEVKSISSNQLICRLPKHSSSNDSNDYEQEFDILAEHDTISVRIGVNFSVNVRKQFSSSPRNPDSKTLLYVSMIFIFAAILSITSIVFFCIISKKTVAKTLKKVKKTRQQMTTLELSVASECKEAFAELQTQMTSFSANDSHTTLAFLKYHSYMINVLFPSFNDHSFILTGKAILIHKEKGLQSFRELLMNRRFLLSFVRTLENEESFSMNDRVYVASLLIITLQKDMEYCTNILNTLMAELIEKYMRGKCHPKLLLRKTESIVEKMLSAWFSLLLYEFLKESAGPALFDLFNAIKEHVSRGPVDLITSQARYCLSENKILRHKFEFFPLTIYVNISQQTAKIVELESPIEGVPVQVLDCDTISQFKEKALDAIHLTINFSQRLNPSELNVEWVHDTSARIILSDDDSSSLTDGEWKQLNTLKHYGVPSGSTLNLISDQEMSYQTSATTTFFNMKKFQNSIKYQPTSSFHKTHRRKMTESTIALIQSSDDVCYKKWHLSKPFSSQYDQEDYNGGNQMLPEIFLTRILATKISLQKFVDELFNVIFKNNNQKIFFPIAIKYMFDFLDDQARLHNITDPEVVHIWKNNCLPLRFWMNLIKNPDFLFDIHKTHVVDSCLSVIAQVFMDSCSTSEQHLNKDSSTTKLLYAKEIPNYNKLVKKYYADIKNMPRISSQDMNTMLVEVSKKYAIDFDTNVSIHELFKYAMKYKEKLINALKNDEFSKDNILVLKLEKVMEILSAVSNL